MNPCSVPFTGVKGKSLEWVWHSFQVSKNIPRTQARPYSRARKAPLANRSIFTSAAHPLVVRVAAGRGRCERGRLSPVSGHGRGDFRMLYSTGTREWGRQVEGNRVSNTDKPGPKGLDTTWLSWRC